MSNKIKLVWLYIGSFLVSIAPIVVIVALNWGHYTSTPKSSLSLAIGGVMAVIFILLKAMDKLPKRVKRIVYYVIGFFMVWLLEPILLDLKLLLLMAIIGEGLDMILFSWRIKRMKEDMLIDRTAEVTSEKVEQAIQNAIEKLNGRV